jgi:phosphate transport system substrate-binding protein
VISTIRHKPRRLILCTLLAASALIPAQLPAQESIPPYASARSVAGSLHIWGPAPMSAISGYWSEGFQQVQPGVRVEIKLLGSDTAIPGLYSGQADLALLGRENNITDDNGFLRPMQYPPTRFELMTGSLDVPGKSPALVVFVHRDNPLRQLTLAQLDAVFGHEYRRGLDNIRNWGDLGLTGEWEKQPIRLFGYGVESGTGQFFTRVVLGNSRKLNWENLQEFMDSRHAGGTIYRAAEQALDALRQERYGMAVSCLCFSTRGVQDLALAVDENKPYVRASRETLQSRQYPLTRTAYVFIDLPPGNPIAPRTKEFLRYIFSREGQADLAREGDYLPLPDKTLAAQRELLEQ